MSNKHHTEITDEITTININGMDGNMLFLPAPKNKKRNILFVYGHHSTIERMSGLIENLNLYGSVTVPDLPGFGGMDSLYKIGKTPTVDDLADYLATFVKLKFRKKKITIIGFSFGFVIVTRMLQKYPEIVDKTELLISAVGFTHKDDFIYTPVRTFIYKHTSMLLSQKLPSILFKAIALNPSVIRLIYAHTKNAKDKFKNLTKAESKAVMNYEVHLWHANDIRTHMRTTHEFFILDNCKVPVNLNVHHISVGEDRYFDNNKVKQHLEIIFSKVEIIPASINSHGPSLILSKEDAAPFIPDKVRKLLSKDPSV